MVDGSIYNSEEGRIMKDEITIDRETLERLATSLRNGNLVWLQADGCEIKMLLNYYDNTITGKIFRIVSGEEFLDQTRID
jgi:hypothetical protein